jgi:hypothetical protein
MCGGVVLKIYTIFGEILYCITTGAPKITF